MRRVKRALITNSSLGHASRLAGVLAGHGYEVSAGVSSDRARAALPAEVTPALLDLSDADSVSEAVARHDLVLHAVGLGAREHEDARGLFESEVFAALNVLEAVRFHDRAGVFGIPAGAQEGSLIDIAVTTAERFVGMYRSEHGARAVSAPIPVQSGADQAAASMVSAIARLEQDASRLSVPAPERGRRDAAAPARRVPRAVPDGRILVTGGNGFIGSHVVDVLREQKYHVTVLDCLGRPHREDVDFVLGDARDGATISRLARSHQGIINLAGILGTSETVDRPRGAVSFNILGALPVFEAARETGITVAHVTVGNYWMNNPYAITKNAAERIALHYNRAYGTRIAVVRGLNAYGERQRSWPVRKIMPNFVLPALSDSELRIYGDGLQRMDMIYVRDLAEVLVRALVLDHGAFDTIFEGGSGVAPTVNEICSLVLDVAESRSPVRHVPMRRGEHEGAIVCADPSTLAPLGMSPGDMLPLREGIGRAITFYRDHGAWY